MKALKNYLPVLCAVFIAFLGGEATLAQNTPPAKGTNIKVERNVIIENGVVVEGDGPMMPRTPAPPGGTFVFVSSEMSFGKIVKGAPYSAEAITETVQTLGDGNRIVNKSSANVYRDSEGRTRRDQTLGAIGPFAAAGDPPQTFFINDPVAGVNFILDPRSHTARKLPLPPFPPMAHGGVLAPGAKELKERELKDKELKDKEKVESFTMMAPPPPGAPGVPGVPMFRYSHTDNENARKESLGKQTIEGVQAEGIRITVTIPAGEIGNEQPINMVTERWYSPELQLVVMSKHSDPRFGETTYRLTNISRNEPARSLFEVPSDYTVKDGGAGVRTFVRTPRPKEEK